MTGGKEIDSGYQSDKWLGEDEDDYQVNECGEP
jgi:hypothetical protein